jgi:hypothetical protein
MNAGLAGGIAGAVIGLAGGLVGAWAGIRNTKGPRERAFVLRAILLLWACMALFLAGLLLLPKPYNWFLWAPYGILLPLVIRSWNRRQARLRDEEERDQGSGGVGR